MTDWLSESVKGIAPSNKKINRRENKMTKKCNCKKCIYCKQIVTSTAIFRVSCKKYGENQYKPTYCDKYITKKELVLQEIK